MSPKRSRRIQEKTVRDKAQAAEDVVVKAPWERGINNGGLPTLPDELLLELLSYYPPIPLPAFSDEDIDTAAHIARRDTLLALSRSSSNLRRFFRPYIWQRIEVCAGMPVGKTTLNKGNGKEEKKAFALELLRQLEIVTIRDPTLAQYVEIVNIEVTDFSVHSVLVELGRCFALFAHLHTVKMKILLKSFSDIAARRGFQKHIYPQIRTLIISPAAFPLLESSPHVKSLECGHDYECTNITKYLHNSPQIESIQFRLSMCDIAEMGPLLPNLRHISMAHSSLRDIYQFMHYSKLLSLSLFKDLQSVTLDMRYPSDNIGLEVIDRVKSILLALQRHDKAQKTITVRTRSYSGSTDTHVMVLPTLRSFQETIS